jgi:hypothetical protein
MFREASSARHKIFHVHYHLISLVHLVFGKCKVIKTYLTAVLCYFQIASGFDDFRLAKADVGGAWN